MNNKNRESEQEGKVRPSVPISMSGIGTRISAVADRLGTRKNAATAAGITTDQLARYIREENQPRLEPMVRLCQAAGVRLDWLTCGEGPMQDAGGIAEANPVHRAPDEPDPDRELTDSELVERAVLFGERLMDIRGVTLPAEKKALLVRLLFERYKLAGAERMDEDTVRYYLRLVA